MKQLLIDIAIYPIGILFIVIVFIFSGCMGIYFKVNTKPTKSDWGTKS